MKDIKTTINEKELDYLLEKEIVCEYCFLYRNNPTALELPCEKRFCENAKDNYIIENVLEYEED